MVNLLSLKRNKKMKSGNKIRLIMKEGADEVYQVSSYKNAISGVTLIFDDGTPEKFVDSALIKQVRVGLLDEEHSKAEKINS